MAEDKEDYSETLFYLAIGGFVVGPLLVLAIMGVILLFDWLTT